MNNVTQYSDPLFKQRVVEYYLKNQLPNRWLDRYDGTFASLQQKYHSGRPPILNKQQINQLIIKVVRSLNRLLRTINYAKIANFIRQETNTNVSLRTVSRYEKNIGIKQKKTVKPTYRETKLRRKIQRVSNNTIAFLDETHVKLNQLYGFYTTGTTLVAPGEKPFVIVTDSSSYAAHYDMIAAIIGNRVLPPIIFTPEDRRTRNVKGINSDMFIDFLENVFCASISELDPCPMYLVSDKSNIHNVSKIEKLFVMLDTQD
ncbi:unnamed protein product [Rotaria sp. Silwood2]|nr:unnamed protein product [Rotaria sp. Silwood2]CAF2901716.1 unnamed protein product [Rotaria sp. Silwood2]CAF3091415.1 unnamed protein product [Rotaria sp. Silwood2]CAF4261629.1 unnamed protein product [Rotaria sp. Silwood2]CAF4265057.1 unnamed protein product [Rotaria sp. Silwood2]